MATEIQNPTLFIAKQIPRLYLARLTHITDTQWGDTGKGKLVDLYSMLFDVIVKTNGGANAGHTVKNEFGTFPNHLVPSGIFNPKSENIISDYVAFNPLTFVEEYSKLLKANIPLGKCFISSDAHLVMPWHILKDKLSESSLGNNKIGTTNRGIGPMYEDKTGRKGLRVRDLYAADFEDRFNCEFDKFNEFFAFKNTEQMDRDEVLGAINEAKRLIEPLVTNTKELIGKRYDEGKSILGEAGQGALLDNHLGGYPYVTSSHPGDIGFKLATNYNPEKVIGSTKAYMTRVGEGPMPTELNNEIGDHLREKGHEYGTTTGRPRRCGWFDTVATEYGIRVSGATELALMKLDVLDRVPYIGICVGYYADGKVFEKIYSADTEMMSKAEPIYKFVEGWQTPTSDIRSFNHLPSKAKSYIETLEELLGKPVNIVSVGPDREQTIFKN